MTQTRTHSAIESIANTAIGYGISLLTQLAVFPLFGIHVSLVQNMWIGVIFTIVSLARSYILRRVFNHWSSRRGQNA